MQPDEKSGCASSAQSLFGIALIESQIDELEHIIENAMDELGSVIMSVPGIGKINGAMILGEIGDIKRFSHPSKLLAYAGLDPVINQSGKFNAKHTKMSKRGSKMLRYALINAAWNVSLNNDTFKATPSNPLIKSDKIIRVNHEQAEPKPRPIFCLQAH